MPSQLALIGGTVYTPDVEIPQGVIILEDGRIKAVCKKDETGSSLPGNEIDLSGMLILPGLIDIHLHGALGVDFLDAGEDDLNGILNHHLTKGTTALLPTLMCSSLEKMIKAVKGISLWRTKKDIADRIIGIHLEGPFINKEQNGIHDKECILSPDKDILLRLIHASRGLIRILTIAPELAGSYELTDIAKKHGIIVSAGHSEASYERMMKAIDQGLSHVCHFFNAMGKFHHREPGIIGAVLNSLHTTAELIMDGIHVHPASAAMLIKMLSPDRVILVTDCSPLVGLNEGVYHKEVKDDREIWRMADEKTIRNNMEMRKEDIKDIKEDKRIMEDSIRIYYKGCVRDGMGHLAGSAITLPRAIKNCVDFGLTTLPQAIAMATSNAARILGKEKEIGALRQGLTADITVLDPDFIPRLVIAGGKIAYKNPY